jgi:putative transposase
MRTLPGASIRRVRRILSFSRDRPRAHALVTAPSPVVDELLAERIQRLIGLCPTFGYRRLWALVRFGQGIRVNRKAVFMEC